MRIKEDGFSLLIVLLFVGIIGSLFSGMLWYQQGEAVRKKSYAAGWHLVQLAKAARLYVRDRSTPTAPEFEAAFSSASLLAASVEVTVADLIDADLLPAGFSSINPLGQNVRIFADNYPPNGGAAQVPTAYLITDEATAGTRSSIYATSRNMASLMQGAREAGMAASAPLIANGVNRSDDCGGTPAVMIWDTGCLNANDINKVTGNTVTIAEGQVIVPAWRVVNQDFRALMRYPQPENIGANTMLTDLHMGHATASQVNPNDPADPAGAPRFNISNVGPLSVSGLNVIDQGDDDGDVGAPQQVLNVAGSLIVDNNLAVSNEVLGVPLTGLPALSISNPTSAFTVTGDMTAKNLTSTGLFTSTQNAAGSAVVAVGNINAVDISGFEEINVQNLGSSADPVDLAISGDGTTTGNMIVQNINEVDTLDIEGNGSAAGADLRVFTQIVMQNPGTVTIQGIGTAVGGAQIRAGTLENATVYTPAVELSDGGRVNGNVIFRDLDVARCDGQCPDNFDNNPPGD